MVGWCFLAALCDATTLTKLCYFGLSAFERIVDRLKIAGVGIQVEVFWAKKEERRTYHRLEICFEVVCLLHAHSILIQRPPLFQ